MKEADRAVANAISCEAKKNSLAQSQSGDWKISFTVAAGDVPAALLDATMGARFLLTLVELNDDETPVEQPENATEPPKDKRRSKAQMAGIMVNDPQFVRFLEQENPLAIKSVLDSEACDLPDAEFHAEVVRRLCGVQSRREFDRDEAAGARWEQLRNEFEAWKRPGIAE